jgi:histidinol-phosphate aminotransferase
MSLSEFSPTCIRSIAPYQPGKPIADLAREMGLPVEDIIKLASNENPLGASPRALAAMENLFMEIARYPDGNGFLLKTALAKKYAVGLNQIVLGNGSNDILDLAARAFLSPDASAVYSKYAFAVYPLATQATGARGIVAPALHYGHDLDAMLAAIADDTRIVFIANPNNPTGTFLESAELSRFLTQVPESVLVVLDEAYTEFLPTASESLAWLEKHPNLLIARTFSKAYGLAGLRVGFALCQPEVADLLNRVRQPFNVSSLAQAAAVAAMEDDAFLAECVQINRAGMQQMIAGFEALGLEYIPSHGNFVAVQVGDAAAINRSLLKRGIIVRPIANYGMPEHLRVSIGLAAENSQFLQALESALGEAK